MRRVSVFISLLLIVFSTSALADAISVANGSGVSRWTLLGDQRMRPDAYRLAYVKASDYSWSQSAINPWLLEWEFAYHKWQEPWRGEDKQGISFTPMFRYQYNLMGLPMYAGFGVGATYIDHNQWMDRQLGSRFMFEDRIELGIALEHHRLSYSINHYSNANLADINHGVNVQYVSYSYVW